MRGDDERDGLRLTKQAQRCLMDGHVWGAITALNRIGSDGDVADYEAVLALGPGLQAMVSNPEQQAACEAVINRARSALHELTAAETSRPSAPRAAALAAGAAPPNGAAAVPHLPLAGTKLCPQCAEEIKAAAVVCRFCGLRFGRAPIEARLEWHEPPATSWVAVVAFLVSLSSLWLAAIPLAIHARRMIDRSGGRIVGRGFATAGLVLGVLGLTAWLLAAAAVAVQLTHVVSLSSLG